MAQQLAQGDAALEAFDRLRLREVGSEYEDTASTFLARFQSTAGGLGPDEWIRLDVVFAPKNGLELLKAVLADPQASKICALRWAYGGDDDVNSIIPLLLNNCPELALLQVEFMHYFALDFVSSMLEHPSNKVKVLHMPPYTGGNLPRFFAALAHSQVSALTAKGCEHPEFYQGLRDYLTKDLLVRLEVKMDYNQVPSEVMMSLAACTRLAELELTVCKFLQPTTSTYLPKSVTKLDLSYCTFAGSFDWLFLAGSNVQELVFYDVGGVDGSQLGNALAVHLRAKGLDKLRFWGCAFVDKTLAAVSVEIGRIKRLEIGRLSNVSIQLLALALQSPNSEMKELRLEYNDDTRSSIEDFVVPALRHPNCNLNKLSFSVVYQMHRVATTKVVDKFRNRRALFVLLQGQQVRRRYCPLRRLPVEMFRLVGEVLL